MGDTRAGERRERALAALRERIRRIERGGAAHPGRRPTALPFGLPMVDRHLPEGGLRLGALHEVAGGGPDLAHGAAAALFAAGILARLRGPVLWCLRAHDLFAPGLSGVGLHADRVIYADAGPDEAAVLAAMEEGLRHPGLAGVVGETACLSPAASRRLQLAAQASGVPALVLRRWRGTAAATDRDRAEPTTAVTRWRVSALPSAPLPAPGVGRPRWRVELVRCRGADPAAWTVEACDAQGRLATPADLADRPAPAAGAWRLPA